MDSKQHKVIIFTTASCPWCMRAKQYLQSQKILYKEVDVNRDKQAANEMVRKSSQQGVPQLWIDGRPVVGFDRQKIDALLGLK